MTIAALLLRPALMNATLTAPLATRILDTFRAPRRLAQRLEPFAPFGGALLIVIVIGMAALFLVPDSFFVEMSANPVDRLGRPVELTSDPATIGRWGRYMAMFTVLVQLAAASLWHRGRSPAALRPAAARRRSGLPHLFRARRARAAHPRARRAHRHDHRPAAWRRDGADSLALLAPGLAHSSRLYAVLEGINPFTVWMLVMLAIAASALQRRDSWRTASLLLVGGYAALAVVVAVVTT